MNSQDFEQMLRALREGDSAPFGEFLRLHGEDLRRVVRIRLGLFPPARDHDFSDIWQSILKSFLRHAAGNKLRPDSPKALLALLITMARNKAATKARRRRRAAGDLSPDWDGATDSPSPLERLADDELVQRAMALLSPEERELLLTHLDGKPYAAIAEERGTTADAVRMRVNRALALVRERYTTEG
jgi:RNA polymerase sigma factor (sigma-70 family)